MKNNPTNANKPKTPPEIDPGRILQAINLLEVGYQARIAYDPDADNAGNAIKTIRAHINEALAALPRKKDLEDYLDSPNADATQGNELPSS